MSVRELHVGDWGTILTITIKDQSDAVVDISSTTAKNFVFKRPDGTTFTRTASFVTDGTDGKLSYTLASGDIDEPGFWGYKAEVTSASFHYETTAASFDVRKRFT